MKKLISFLLTICLCGLALSVFAGCGDNKPETSHHFQTAWTSDATHHWHACDDKGCTEVSERAEHSWDDGCVTREPVLGIAGERTFSCTVCAATRTESLNYEPAKSITEEEWKAAFAQYDNLTVYFNLVYKTGEIKQDGAETATEVTYGYHKNVMIRDGNRAYVSIPGEGDVFEINTDAENHPAVKMFYSLFIGEELLFDVLPDHFGDFAFVNGEYVLEQGIEGLALNGKQTGKIVVRFADGALSEVVLIGAVYNDEYYDSLTITNIGNSTTVFPEKT